MKDKYGQVCYVKKDNKYYFESESMPFYGIVSLGNHTAFDVYMNDKPNFSDELYIGIKDFGFYVFWDFVHWQYAKEKLNIPDTDAKAIADFINAQLHDSHLDYELQGNIPYVFN